LADRGHNATAPATGAGRPTLPASLFALLSAAPAFFHSAMPSTLSTKSGVCRLAPNPAQRLVFAQLLELGIKGADDELTTTQLAAKCVLGEEESQRALADLIERGLCHIEGGDVDLKLVSSLSIESISIHLKVEQERLDLGPETPATMPSVSREEIGLDEYEAAGMNYRVSVLPQVIDGQANGWYVLNILRADGEHLVIDKEFESQVAAWEWADDWREPIDLRFWLKRLPVDEPYLGHNVDVTYLETETMDCLIHELYSDDHPEAMEGSDDEQTIWDRTFVRSVTGHRWPGLHLADTCEPDDEPEPAEIQLSREEVGVEKGGDWVAAVTRVEQPDGDIVYNAAVIGATEAAPVLMEGAFADLSEAWGAIDEWKAKQSTAVDPVPITLSLAGCTVHVTPSYLEGMDRFEFRPHEGEEWHKDVASSRLPRELFHAEANHAAAIELAEKLMAKRR